MNVRSQCEPCQRDEYDGGCRTNQNSPDVPHENARPRNCSDRQTNTFGSRAFCVALRINAELRR